MRKTLLYCALLYGCIITSTVKAQVWEPVGNSTGISSGGVGRLTLQNDANDNLYVGYYDLDVMKGSVQKFNGTNWEHVGGQGMTSDYTLFNSLSVSSQGTPYFLNQAGYPNSGHEAKVFQNGTWTALPKVTNEQINYSTSTFSANDVLFASNGENGGTVKKLVNGAWVQVGNTGIAGGVPTFIDMASGSDGKVYVSFNTNSAVHVYVDDENASTNDQWQPVGGVADLGEAATSEFYNSSLTIDQNNHIYIAYVSKTQGGNKLNVKKYDGTSWKQLGAENFSQGRVQHISIAVGANNIVYVAASNWENDNVLKNYVLAYDEESNSWNQTGTGFASTGEGTFNSLEVDSEGNLYLAFSDSALGKLSVKN